LQNYEKGIIEINEGHTKILVPNKSLIEKVPPKEPAFFNPRAKLNRDFSIIVYSVFAKNFKGPKIFLDGLSGLGARGLRVANEIENIEKVIVNDLNSNALALSLRSAELNELKNFEISENEVCRFMSKYSKKNLRGSMVDIDPFGSPSQYIDCGIRATMHGGLLSVTATDLQVLHGLFQNACMRRYGGIPIKTEYANEIAIRLILGCVRFVAARLDIEIIPIFVENNQHYYRIYMKILNRPDQTLNIGYISHCNKCGNREITKIQKKSCGFCNSEINSAGPLWIGKIFEKKFVEKMLNEVSNLSVDKKCEKILTKCLLESEMPGMYYTLDEIASKMKISPLKLEKVIEKLKNLGFSSSPTSLNPSGFRTNAMIHDIEKIFVD